MVDGSARRRAERVEVRRSRERILAAVERLCERGTAELTMSAVAREAGVGNATLYRRFPDLRALLTALHEQLMAQFDTIALEIAKQPSGWDAIITAISGIARTLIEHPAMPHVYRRLAQLDPEFSLGAQWDEPLAAVVAVAQGEGSLRADVDGNDIAIAAFRLGEFAHHPEPERSALVARQLAITIDGLRAAAAVTPVPGRSIGREAIDQLIRLEGESATR